VAAGRAAIIVFGAGLRPDGSPSPTLTRRIDAAISFGRRLRPAPLYLPTGGVGRHGPAEAQAMAQRLERSGIGRDAILVEPTARDTLASVLACERLLRNLGHRGPVFAATSAYHLPRCLLLLRLAGLRARAVPPPREPAARRWRKRWYWRLRELPAVPYDAMLLLWKRPRRVRRLDGGAIQ